MYMLCSSQIINEMLFEVHLMEKCYFPKPVIHSQIIYSLFFSCRGGFVYVST